MKLHWSPRSPFVRKVMVVAHEIGVADRMQCVRTVAAMMKPHAGADDRQSIVEDPDPGARQRHGALRFRGDLRVLRPSARWPEAVSRLPFDERMTALRRQALGDGLLDALVLWRGELSRPAEQQSKPYLESFASRNEATLAASNAKRRRSNPARIRSAMSPSDARFVYLDFRFADRQWRKDHPQLARWHATFARPSIGPRNRARRRRVAPALLRRWLRPRPSP